jgi:hypothetical protein
MSWQMHKSTHKILQEIYLWRVLVTSMEINRNFVKNILLENLDRRAASLENIPTNDTRK